MPTVLETLMDCADVVLALSPMSEDEAKTLGVSESERQNLVRLDQLKGQQQIHPTGD